MINVIGPLHAPSAAGIVARSTVEALAAAGIAVAAADSAAGADWAALPYDLDLFVADPRALAALPAGRPEADRRQVLLGWCALPNLPIACRAAAARMHAILTPNAFAAAAFRASGCRSVSVVPFVPLSSDAAGAVRGDGFVFACELDPASSLERQNLNYVLNAFVRAFAGRRDVALDVALRASGDAPAMLPFDAISAAYPNVRFSNGGGAADAFVSLDRADALGLGILAAMGRGLPVVAPAYAAAADVLDESTGEPVPFVRLAVPSSDPTFAPSGEPAPVWADPSIDAAAIAMRRLVEDPARARRLGDAARERIDARRARFRHGDWLRALFPRSPQAVTAGTHPRRISVAFEGEFRSPLSLAHINRELAVRFARDPGIEVFGIDHVPVPDPAIALAPELAPRMRSPAEAAELRPDVRIALHWPPMLERRPAHRYVAFLPWELSEVPASWRDAIGLGIDAVWALSQHSRDAFLRADIAEDKVTVLSLGIDPALLRPDGPKLDLPARTFRFLYVGGTVGRKGFDFVDRAFFRTFGPADDVSLVVKDVGTDSVYRDGNAATYLRGLAARRDTAHLVYLDRTLSDAEIAALYRSCDALVAPYRAEGFGLPILEAMACGLPVIVTAGGASDDFVDDGCGLRIPAARVAAPRDVGLRLVRDAWVLEPDLERLRAAMRTVVNDAALRERLGAAAAARAATWTWDRTAARAREAIGALL